MNWDEDDKLRHCSSSNANLSKLLPFFLDDPNLREDVVKISPSRLRYELQMSTEDRLEQLSKQTRRLRVHTDASSFSRTPDIIVFQNFSTNNTYKTTLTLQNLQQFSRHVRLLENPSLTFTVKPFDENVAKIAPGMTFVFTVTFHPVEVKDYFHELTFLSEGESFTVPVYGICQRPIAYISDHLTLPPTAVRVESRKSVTMHNSGERPMFYVISYKQPFEVSPVRGCLNAKQTGEIIISCKSDETCLAKGEIIISYDTLKLVVEVECDVKQAELILRQNYVVFEDVYMGLTAHKTIAAQNQSNHKVDFSWRMFKSNAVDELEKAKYLNALGNMVDMEKKKYVQLERMNVIDADGHCSILERNFEIDAEDLETNTEFLYHSNIFEIIPQKGHILPRQTIDFTIIFSPTQNDFYSEFAYLDVTGKTERLPLRMSGGGKGPDVILSTKVVNINDIFLKAQHEFEVVATNIGHIPATVAFKSQKTDFGGVIKCVPKNIILHRTDACRSFLISFSSSSKGKFVEKVEFVIEESKEEVCFILVGNVVCPLLDLSVMSLNFGEVSFGDVITKEVLVENNSQVPIDFLIKFDAALGDFLKVEPMEGIVEPFSQCDLTVTFTGEKAGKVNGFMFVHMWISCNNDIFHKLPVESVVQCVEVECDPPEMFIDFCFIGFEYKRSIIFRNKTSFHGHVLHTPGNLPEGLSCDLSNDTLYVDSFGQAELELTILCSQLGTLKYPMTFTVSGGVPKLYFTLTCNVQGPVLSIFPEEVNLGLVKLLTETSSTLTLINDSPIKGDVQIVQPYNTSFKTDVKSLEIPPESSCDITLHCYLTIHGQHKDTITFNVAGGDVINVNVTAEGVGHSILVEPYLEPIYDAGIFLTHQQYKLSVKFTNMGRRLYKLQWLHSPAVNCRNFKELSTIKHNSAVFEINPAYMEIAANQMLQAEISGVSRVPKDVEQGFYCYAASDKQSKIALIMSFIFKAVFEEPVISFSKSQLNFLWTKNKPRTETDALTEPGLEDDSTFSQILVKQQESLDVNNSVESLEIYNVDLEPNLKEEGVDENIEESIDSLEIDNVDLEPNLKVEGVDESIEGETETESDEQTGENKDEFQEGREVGGGSQEINESKDEGKQENTDYCEEEETLDASEYTLKSAITGFVFKIPRMHLKSAQQDCQSILTNEITLTNECSLPLSFDLIASDNYYIKDNKRNLVSSLCSHLGSGEQYTTEIHFKPVLKEQKYSIIMGKLVVLYHNHPNTEVLPLIGEICYPTVLVKPEIDFGCIPPGSHAYITVVLQNITFVPAVYKWEFVEQSFEICQLDKPPENVIPTKPEVFKNTEFYLRHDESESVDEDAICITLKPVSSPITDNLVTAKATKITQFAVNDDLLKIGNEFEEKWDGATYEKEIRAVLLPIMETLPFDGDGGMYEDLVTNFKYDPSNAKNVFSIEPSKGFLMPYEYVVVNISFCPPPDVRVKIAATLNVDEGHKEKLTIKGSTSQISYKFEPTYVDFDRRLYYEISEREITLTNTGYGSFEVKVTSDNAECLYPGMLNVTPKIKTLLPDESVTFTVKYFPGYTGEFLKYFIVEIGYLEPLRVYVHGYASFCQIGLSLPRPDIQNNFIYEAYRAISHLSNKYLRILNAIGADTLSKSDIYPYPDDIPLPVFRHLVVEDWMVYSKHEIYPSSFIIDLAIENDLLNSHLITSNILSKTELTDIKLPAYVLDFGPVILGTSVCFTVNILNYGPGQTEIKAPQKKQSKTLESNEFKLELGKKRKLGVGESTEIYVLFKPSKKKYGLTETAVEEYVTVVIRRGMDIRINIKAIVTMPRIELKYDCIDFDNVQFGHAVRKSILMKNDGYIPSKWTVELTLLRTTKLEDFYIFPNEGIILPNETALLNIYFLPTSGNLFEATATIYIEGNLIPTVLKLIGQGIEPILVLSTSKLDFTSALPYSEDNEMICSLQNLSQFSIEYCFTEYDPDYDEEKMFINAYLYYYNLDAVLVPRIYPGCRIPDFFHGNYYFLMGLLRQKMLNDMHDTEKEHCDDPLDFYTPEDIFPLIQEYIARCHEENDTADTQEYQKNAEQTNRVKVIEPEVNTPNIKTGLYIIFYGGPYTEYYKAANRAAIAMSLPVHSVDRLLLDELNANETTTANEVNSLIDETLAICEITVNKYDYEDDYDVLQKKIDLFIDGKVQKSGSKKDTKRSKPSSEKGSAKSSEKSTGNSSGKNTGHNSGKGKGKGKKNAITLEIIPTNLIVELLYKQLKTYKTGLIIESLNSNFVNDPRVLFEMLLTCFDNVRHVHFVILQYTWENFINDKIENMSRTFPVEPIKEDSPIKVNEAKKISATSNKKSKKGSGKKGSGTGKKKNKQLSQFEIAEKTFKSYKPPFVEFSNIFGEIVEYCEKWILRNKSLNKSNHKLNKGVSKESKVKVLQALSKTSVKMDWRKSSITFSSVFALDFGVPLLVINNATSQHLNNLYDVIGNLLKSDLLIQRAQEDLKVLKTKNYVEETIMFSAMRKLKRKKKILSEVFKITTAVIQYEESDGTITTDTMEKSVTTPSDNSQPPSHKRKLKKKHSRMYAPSIFKAPILSDVQPPESKARVIHTGQFVPRVILHPGERKHYKVTFHPKVIGVYKHAYNFEIRGLQLDNRILCEALCEIPKIDFTPERVFQKVLPSKTNRKRPTNEFVYAKDENTFHFGSILISTEKNPYITKFNLSNISTMLCIVTVELQSDNRMFNCLPMELVIDSKSSETLTVSIEPESKRISRLLQASLYLTLKNNPEVWMVNLQAEPRLIEFSYHPKVISFNEVPLDYRSKRCMVLKNNSPVDLFWKLHKTSTVAEFFKFSATCGDLKKNSTEKVTFEYAPKVEENVGKKTLDLQVFDLKCSCKIPFYSDTVTLFASSIQQILCYENYINIGDVKGKKKHSIWFTIGNEGQCAVSLTINEIEDSPTDKKKGIRKFFKLKSMNNSVFTLYPSSTEKILIYFEPTKEIEFQHVPVYICSTIDTSNEQDNIIRSFYIYFSAQVYLTSFEICPPRDVYFGHQQIKSKKTLIMEIKNTGKFDFNFVIKKQDKETRGSKRSASSKKSSKSGSKASSKKSEQSGKKDKTTKQKSNSSKSKSSKSKSPKSKSSKKGKKKTAKSLVVDGFQIMPESGEVPKGKNVQIYIECMPLETRNYEETILVQVSEPKKDAIAGKPVTLHVEGSEPLLGFNQLDKMFKATFFIDKLDHFIPPYNAEDHCVFVSSEKALYFSKVPIHTTKVAEIFIYNISLVDALVSVKLHDHNKFNVSPNDLVIYPSRSEKIEVSYTPINTNRVENQLEISYNRSKDSTFTIKLYGDSCIPRIALLEPVPDEETHSKTVVLPLTFVGETETLKVAVKNIGEIQCKVIFDLSDNEGYNFLLEVCPDTVEMLNINITPFKRTSTSTLINLKSKEVGHVMLHFCPKKEGVFDFLLKIYTDNNPFETYTVNVKAQSYLTELCIKGMPASADKENVVSYNLDFGYTIINSLQIKSFALVNYSSNNNYKFHFVKPKNLLIIPSVGHIKCDSRKELIASFSTKYPTDIQKLKFELKYTPITYNYEQPPGTSWDNRQQLGQEPDDLSIVSSNLNSSMKSESRIIEKLPVTNCGEKIRKLLKTEPWVVYSSEGWNTTPIYFSIVVGYASYTCTTGTIQFPTTFVRESSELTFEVANDGLVPIEIEWTFKDEFDKPVSSAGNLLDNIPLEKSDKDLSLKSGSFTSMMSVVTITEEAFSFKISPSKAVIPPTSLQTFTCSFIPTVAANYLYKLQSNIESLNPELQQIDIVINATSLVPNFYVELPQTDFSFIKAILEQDPNIKVVGFDAVGTGYLYRSKVILVNNYPQVVTFKIKPLEEGGSYFECKTLHGSIQPNKKYEVIINFLPQELGSFEETYKFWLVEQVYETAFLLVGTCREPKVGFTTAHITMKPTLPNVKTSHEVLLRNDEDVKLKFKFVKRSLISDDQGLTVYPMSGCLPPKSDIPIKLTYNSFKIGTVEYFVKCSVERLKDPLSLYINACCLEVQASLYYYTAAVRHDLEPEIEAVVDLGNLPLRKKFRFRLCIDNFGATGFYYEWQFNKKLVEKSYAISVDKERNFIQAFGCTFSHIIIEPLKRTSLHHFKMILQISYGQKYILKVNATAKTAHCQFSFHKYDFGYCLVQKNKKKNYVANLELKNMANIPLTLENNFEDTIDLTVDFKSVIVPPNSSQLIPIYFHPQKVGNYNSNVLLQVNSNSFTIKVLGVAIRPNLQLLNARDKMIDLGKIKVGTMKPFTIEVINRTPTKMQPTFGLWDQLFEIQGEKVEPEIKVPEIPLPSPSKKGKKGKKKKGGSKSDKSSKKSKKSKSTKSIKSKSSKSGKKHKKKKQQKSQIETVTPVPEPPPKYSLNIVPKEPLELDFNQKNKFTIELTAKERFLDFEEKIFYKVHDHIEPLCVIAGSCIASSYTLDKNIITFSNVVVGHKHNIYVFLSNNGDTEGWFTWTFLEDSKVFAIEPSEGYIKTDSTKTIKVQFAPETVQCQFKNKVICKVEDTPPLELLLIGTSMDIPEPSETLEFVCSVRGVQSKKILIQNPSKIPWKVITNNTDSQFEMLHEFEIPPEKQKEFFITYHPMKITRADPDTDYLHVCLPEGQVIVYKLVGNALPPLPEKKISLEVVCKQNHSEILKINNPSNTKQCFKVFTKLTSPVTTKTLYKVQGLDLIEIMPHATKDYKWTIYVVNETPLDFTVTFTSLNLIEYLFFEIHLDVLPCEPIDTINLEACVRNVAQGILKLTNPINIPVKFELNSKFPELKFDKEVAMEPYSTYNLKFDYLPLTSGEFQTTLEAHCEELGTFIFTINMKVKPSPMEDLLKFTAELGGRCERFAERKNTLNTAVEFTPKFDHPAFIMQNNLMVPAESTGKFAITFEPNELGKINGFGTLNSKLTGEYIYGLIGICVPPTPKGPFVVKSGGSTAINFFNPFLEEHVFTFKLDSSTNFFLKDKSQLIKPKKSTKITVGLNDSSEENIRHSVTGRLTVACDCQDDTHKNIKWIFYIQSGQ